ncbi:hypothetical protein NUU61_007227 [Penicillium alfredii]|uniref:Uncharacterized protein n=1 Tax=Penicillium alfredii TaxID=1506179 RepID=A0A9W9K502_9EURO|nr:uncharacterized protein NUU61_007227 [Penicillium alfredii]KAJ5092357.1 hypothetical protein NUU61_007227 [Penicillium alfredii]
MTTEAEEYAVEQEMASFFRKTSAIRSSCDARAQELVGGTATPVIVQGVCGYTVYAGPNQEFVVQFRLQSLRLKTEITTLASKIYGSLVSSVSHHGQIGEDDLQGREPVAVYVMSRVQGVSYLDFILAHNLPEKSVEYYSWRENLISDFCRRINYFLRSYAEFLGYRFFAVAWKNPQNIYQSVRETLYQRYGKDLR